MRSSRIGTIIDEVRLDLRLRNARRRERAALTRLGEAAASGSAPADPAVAQLVAEARQGRSGIEHLESALAVTLENDRTDFSTVSRWMRPLVMLRGLCARTILHHQIALVRHALAAPHHAIGAALSESPRDGVGLPRKLFHALADTRSEGTAILEERSRRLEPYGGSALPSWFPHLGRESAVFGRAFWTHLRAAVLPRGPALAALGVGWWLGNTYTDSHLHSVLHSLGIGSGGKRVVSGETYRTMMFWLPIVAAALFAYLADRVQHLIQRRYSRAIPRP
jgi:hypothetical protein